MLRVVVIFMAMLLASLHASAQGETALSFTGMNAIVCFSTPLRIVAENTPCDDVTVTVSNGTIEKREDCRFWYRPEKPGQAVLKMSVRTKDGTKEIGERQIRVLPYPAPMVRFAGSGGGSKPAAVLRLHAYPEVAYSCHDNPGPRFVVYAFTVLVVRNGQVVFQKRHRSPQKEAIGFDAETKEFMTSLRAGDLLWIKDMAAYGAGWNYTDLDEIKIHAE